MERAELVLLHGCVEGRQTQRERQPEDGDERWEWMSGPCPRRVGTERVFLSAGAMYNVFDAPKF